MNIKEIEDIFRSLEEDKIDLEEEGCLNRLILPELELNINVYLAINIPSNRHLLMVRMKRSILSENIVSNFGFIETRRVALPNDDLVYCAFQVILKSPKHEQKFLNLVEDIVGNLKSIKSEREAKETLITCLNPKYIKNNGIPISFAKTVEEIKQQKKTVTRRQWSERTAQIFTNYYHQKYLVKGYDKSPRNGGKQICWLRLTLPPYQQQLSKMTIDDVIAEGAMVDTPTEFINKYFDGQSQTIVWVVEFQITEVFKP